MPFCYLTLRAEKPKDSRYPTELRTIGDRLRKRRLDLGLLQQDVADRLGIDVANIRNWEQNKTNPEVRFLPAILGFLGYDPDTCPTSLPEALRKARRAAGLSQEDMAKRAGFDETTIAKWERGSSRPFPGNVARLRRFFETIGQALPDFGEQETYGSQLRAEKARRAWATRRRS